MMTPDNEAPEAPLQSEEARTAILQKSAAGRNTASGQAREDLARKDDEKPDTPEGSELPIVGGEPQPDHPSSEGAITAKGAQAQPAIIVSNGTIPVNHVSSPAGLVPVSAVAADPHQGARLVQDNLDAAEEQTLRSGNPKLSRAKIESMSAGDLRAVASDRGYDLGGYTGARQTRQRFLAAQKNDENVPTDETGSQTDAALDKNIAP
jgi:hypothetical protein